MLILALTCPDLRLLAGGSPGALYAEIPLAGYEGVTSRVDTFPWCDGNLANYHSRHAR